MYYLFMSQGEKKAKVECSHLIPLIVTVKDQMKYYPYAVYEIWEGDDECLYESKYDRFQRAKAGWRIIKGPREEKE